MSRYYFGFSTSGHDPALALVDEVGNLLFAEATERFMQDKRAWGIAPDHPGHLSQILDRYCEPGADIVAATSWSHEKNQVPVEVSDKFLPRSDGIWIRSLQARINAHASEGLAADLGLERIADVRHFDHHLCHAAAACHSAPFRNGLCLVLDGEGEVGAASLFRLRDGRLKRLWRSWGPGSLGVYYAWLTNRCGFDWRAGEEWKVMGLAAYGTPDPKLVELLSRLLSVDKGRLKPSDAATVDAVLQAVPAPRRSSESVMAVADLAASGQQAYSMIVDRVLGACLSDGDERLVLTGGCALNSAYNGTILRRFPLQDIHVPSAPADDGNALGAALLAWSQDHPESALPVGDGSPFLGSPPDPGVIAKAVSSSGFPRATDLGTSAPDHLAGLLAKGRIVGVMRDRAEFGPRALGHRSILADPRSPDMKDRINRLVKGREPYRPFAPAVLAERAEDWFDHPQSSPYMSFTLPFRHTVVERVPAVVHEDGTGRLQTVEAAVNPSMHALLEAFERETGVPIVLNTSFNIMGKPIVHTVQDAMAVLATTGLDAVLLNHVLIEKNIS